MRSLQARISISTGIAVVAAIAVQASITAYWTYETAVSSAAANALSDARFQGSALKAEIEVALDTARTLAHVLAGSKSAHGSSALTRNQVLAMLQETTRRHPDFLGAYTAWEPGTFDNNDLKFAGTKGHDKTGRFLPYVVHNAKGEISVEPLTDLETQERGPTGVRKGEYYLCPKDSHAECVLDPFPYEIDGKAMMMTSLVVPILVDGRFLGITGIDIALSTVQQRVDEFSHGGRMLILSNNGRIVAVSNKPEVAGRYAAEFLPSLAKEAVNGLLHSSGESSRKGDELMAAAPVSFGDSHTPWSIVMLLPYDSITRGARSMVTGISLVGIVTAVIAVSLVVFILGGSIRRVLLQIVSDLRERAVQVTAASRQIAAASRALAESASQQAAALEETSASTQEVNAKAANNSDHSRATVSLVNQSRQEINGANDKLQEMVASITQIQTSSDKISKIINTIDGIAFQTNILALNAAVEAARAGEAGLGFAVVADEVRNLAQRCTQAAHETSALIEESVAGSQEGRGKVDMVVTSISCLTEQSGKVMSLVDQVAAGSTEQARGIEHIAKAIAEMEQVTQRVAASAEECASASREMAEQSVRVEQTVRTLEALVGARSK